MNYAAIGITAVSRWIFTTLALILILAAMPARADKQVIFSRLTDGPEFDQAMEFFAGYFKPEQYDTAKRLRGTGGGWKLGHTLDLYLREFIKFGKGDIDDDGIDERFYILEDPGWCGSGGCLILIVRKRLLDWKVLCEESGGDDSVWITDWVSLSGYRELETTFRVYWHDDKCYSTDPKLLNEYRPENYPRPPTERTWKPLK